jgi:hypothetical protein
MTAKKSSDREEEAANNPVTLYRLLRKTRATRLKTAGGAEKW